MRGRPADEFACPVDDRRREPGHLGDPDPVRRGGGTLTDTVAERHPPVRPCRVEVAVANPWEPVGQIRQVVVVGGEDGRRPQFVVEELDCRTGDRVAVGRRRAPAHLVEEDERAFGRVVEDRSELRHLPHERRLPARDVVTRADAREHPVDDRQPGGLGGDETARLCQHDRHRDLAHVGGLPAHVRPREERDTPPREPGVVRDELRLRPFDHRVAAALEQEPVVCGSPPARLSWVEHGRPRVVPVDGDRRQPRERVQPRDGVRQRLDSVTRVGDPVPNLGEHLVL